METNAITRAVIESMVDRGIRRIAEDPERGLRNLVDMGITAATGRFQKHYMGIMRSVLEDEGCPYYELVCRTVRQTETRNLTRFGVNIGWQSWTVGAQSIRRCEAKQGLDVPWSLTLHMEGGAEGPDWGALLRAGQEYGIYTYFLHTGADQAALGKAAALIKSAPLGAFLLFAAPEAVTRASSQLSGLDNLMVLVDTSADGWQEAAAALREERRLYGFWRLCEADGLEAAARSLEDIQYEGGTVAFLIPAPSCGEAERTRLRQFTRESWGSPRYPLLVFDYYDDILLVDGIISGGSCFVGVLPDGQATMLLDGQERPAGARPFWDALLGA